MKSKRTLSTAIAACLLVGCASQTKLSQVGPSPLAVASCPELAPLKPAPDGTVSMGELNDKLTEVGGIYRECREAALAP